MGMPTEPILDIMRRSMVNLEYVEDRAGPSGPFEVTQLVNTFLGALVHPWEAMRDDLQSLPIGDARALGWPAIVLERPNSHEPSSVGDLIRLMRNAMAHGNIEFLSDGRGRIHALRLWNINRAGKRNCAAIVTIRDMRDLLTSFVALLERRHQDFVRYPKGVA